MNMKKIGIMTYHRSMNFGAKLQAFALQNVLKENYDTYIVDYRCEKIEAFFYPKKTLKSRLRNLARMILRPHYYRELKRRRSGFISFDTHFRMTECYTNKTIAKAKGEFDAFIVGSDQVWNLDISGNDMNYFLPFADDCQKYTYAVSFGSTIKEDDLLWSQPELFSGFQSLLIREQSGVDFLNKLLPEKVCSRTVDPVFLLDKDTWVRTFRLEKKRIQKPYVLVYFVAKIQQTYALAYAKRIASEKNLQIIYVNAGMPSDSGITYKNDVDPVSFLDLIYNAYIVITTSFHAEAFSILFNVPFMYELVKTEKNTNTRLSSLAALFELEKQEIASLETEPSILINWKNVNSHLVLLRNTSRNALMDSLSSLGK